MQYVYLWIPGVGNEPVPSRQAPEGGGFGILGILGIILINERYAEPENDFYSSNRQNAQW